jgi:hypothetical protein
MYCIVYVKKIPLCVCIFVNAKQNELFQLKNMLRLVIYNYSLMHSYKIHYIQKLCPRMFLIVNYFLHIINSSFLTENARRTIPFFLTAEAQRRVSSQLGSDIRSRDLPCSRQTGALATYLRLNAYSLILLEAYKQGFRLRLHTFS